MTSVTQLTPVPARPPLRRMVGTVDESMVPLLRESDGDDIVWALAHLRFATGDEPYMASRDLQRTKPDALLRPAGGDVLRSYRSPTMRTELVDGDGWTLVARRWRDGSACVVVAAVGRELAELVAAEATRDAEEAPADDGRMRTPLWFWHLGERAPARERRRIETPSWEEIESNYASPARRALAALHAFRPDPGQPHGRLVLLHGPPGTGKTTALRALARSWHAWCDVDVVLDPEHLFSDTRYLLQVALGERDGDDYAPLDRHRLLVLEDCDELVRADASAGSRRQLARLLNLTDGLLGQGLDVLVALTTNEPLQRLHPAVVRAGRCLAEIEVGRIDSHEAASRLGVAPQDLPSEGIALADLLARAGSMAPPTAAAAPAATPGQYL